MREIIEGMHKNNQKERMKKMEQDLKGEYLQSSPCDYTGMKHVMTLQRGRGLRSREGDSAVIKCY